MGCKYRIHPMTFSECTRNMGPRIVSIDAMNPQERLEAELERVENDRAEGKISESEADGIKRLSAATDPEDFTIEPPENGNGKAKPKATVTRKKYVCLLRKLANWTDTDLHELDSETINECMVDLRKGRITGSEASENYVMGVQVAMRYYVRVNDCQAKPENIHLVTPPRTKVNPADMLTRDEIEAAQEACGNARDRAIFDMLLYTGQRNTAIRTVKIDGIDLEEGTYRLNSDVDGLKGAIEQGKERPLLGAKAAIRDWLKFHPEPDNPDAFLITGRPGYTDVDPETPVTAQTLGRVMRDIKDSAGIEKPMHPHAMRHNFVTMCVREYEMDPSTIKWLIGHTPDSQVMETTYSHLYDSDKIERARQAAGIVESDESERLTPHVCHTCGANLGPTDAACRECGTLYSPDAHSAKREAEDRVLESAPEADSEESDALSEMIDMIRERPDLMAEAMETIRDESDE